MNQLTNKVAVITGASRGLGRAIAEAYAAEGAKVILAARSRESVQSAVTAIQQTGAQAIGVACDVGDPVQVQALADVAITEFGKIDVWVNNAGLAGIYGPTASIPADDFEMVTRTNIMGTYYGSMVALRHFLPRNTGKLINLLGRGDTKPVALQSAYASSKAWIRNFTLALAQESKGTALGIFAFNPGLVDTDMLLKIDVIAGYEERLKPFEKIVNLIAKPPAIPAQKAVWLASSATDGKTGLAVNVFSRTEFIGDLLRGLVQKNKGKSDTGLTLKSVQPELTEGSKV